MKIQKTGYVLLAIACWLTACDSTSREKPNSPLWGGFDHKTIYVLTDDVFLLSVEQNRKSPFVLSPPENKKPSGRYYKAPRTINQPLSVVETKDDEKAAAYHLHTVALGIVRKGTRLEVVEVIRERQVSWFFGAITVVTVYAKLLDGEYGGRIVDVLDISSEQHVQDGGIVTYEADPAFLRPVEMQKTR